MWQGPPAHERLWLTDGDAASSSESVLKLRTNGALNALQSGVALPIHTATPWHGSFKTQKRLTSFSVAPQRRGHKVARVRPAETLFRASYFHHVIADPSQSVDFSLRFQPGASCINLKCDILSWSVGLPDVEPAGIFGLNSR